MASSRSAPAGTFPTGLDALRDLVLQVLRTPALAIGPVPAGFDLLLSQAYPATTEPGGATGGGPTSSGGTRIGAPGDDGGNTEQPEVDDRGIVVDLVRRAQAGDADAFGALYDRYVDGIYRFCYHRTTNAPLAEDLTSETFFRALRAISTFQWQGRDFGAWLTTIARNLVTDHYKSSRSRHETVTAELPEGGDHAPGPEDLTLSQLTSEVLARGLRELPDEQRDCLVMRFLQGLSIAETAEALERSDGAVKQLQLRAVRSLARWLPEDLR